MTYTRAVVYQDEPRRRLQHFLDPMLENGSVRDVLDAGCGYSLAVDFPSSVRLIGLDTSADALAKNENVDEGIVGDIETYPLVPESYDAVLCWTVLEHLSEPRTALANMARSLRPCGLLIVGVPRPWSLKGLITKLTPHRFHVWVYRRVFGVPDAGSPGNGPFRTYLRREIAPRRLEQIARLEGLERIYADTYEPELGLPRFLKASWSVVNAVARVASLGRWQPQASEHIAVFRKLAPG